MTTNSPADQPTRKPRPPLNEAARIVNSHFLNSPYEGKDWEAVRKSMITALEPVFGYVPPHQEQVIPGLPEDSIHPPLAENNTWSWNYGRRRNINKTGQAGSDELREQLKAIVTRNGNSARIPEVLEAELDDLMQLFARRTNQAIAGMEGLKWPTENSLKAREQNTAIDACVQLLRDMAGGSGKHD